MRAEQLLHWTGRGARLVGLFAVLSSAATTSACVCTPTEDQACEEEPEELYDVSGWVTINGARTQGVWIVSSTGDSVRTNLSGEFHFELPLSGTTVTARAPAGTAFLRASALVSLTGRDSIHFEGYRLASVSGQVRFNGQPVRAILELDGPITAVDTAGPDGAYRFDDVPPEPTVGYRLEIVGGPQGISRASERFTVAGVDIVRDFEATFIEGATIGGTVTIGAAGLAGVVVTVSGAFTATDTTDAAGRFSLPRLPAGEYTVTIAGFDPGVYSFTETSRAVTLQAGALAQVDFTGTEIRPNQPPVPVITQPADGAVFVEGTPITFGGGATDPEDGVLGGASLVWTEGSGVPLGSGPTVTTSTLSALAHRIWLTATDAQGRSGATSIVITVVPSTQPGSISGRVTANGYGVGDVLVTLSGAASATAVTDGNAAYSFPNLLPGTYTVTISGYPSAISFPSTSQTVSLAGGQNLVVNFAGTY